MRESGGTGEQLARLMRRAQEGQSAAYAELLREVAPLLRSEIRRRLRFLPPQDVEDLVQDVLLSLHVVRSTYDPARPFLPWLMAIAHNRVVDGIRRQVRRNANEVAVDEPPETFATDATNRFDESYGDPEALRQAMQRLPQGQRTAIELVKLREMSLKEAAAVSGMSVPALKVAVHRGIGALRKVLNVEGKA
ncbi:MAG: sigma-70 family RNA polymerase sigma factor [Rhizobiales bacterium]|nr:sigma-70 family RNA polymerase sigma factor [Hyphomicrobiales bacterium]